MKWYNSWCPYKKQCLSEERQIFKSWFMVNWWLITKSSMYMPLVLSADHWMLGPLAIDPVGYGVFQHQLTPLGPAVSSQSYTHHDKEEQGLYCSPSWPAYLVRSVIRDLLSKYSQVWPESALDTGPSLFTISVWAYCRNMIHLVQMTTTDLLLA